MLMLTPPCVIECYQPEQKLKASRWKQLSVVVKKVKKANEQIGSAPHWVGWWLSGRAVPVRRKWRLRKPEAASLRFAHPFPVAIVKGFQVPLSTFASAVASYPFALILLLILSQNAARSQEMEKHAIILMQVETAFATKQRKYRHTFFEGFHHSENCQNCCANCALNTRLHKAQCLMGSFVYKKVQAQQNKHKWPETHNLSICPSLPEWFIQYWGKTCSTLLGCAAACWGKHGEAASI